MIYAYGIDLIFDYHAYVYFLISSHTPHTPHTSHTSPPPEGLGVGSTITMHHHQEFFCSLFPIPNISN